MAGSGACGGNGLLFRRRLRSLVWPLVRWRSARDSKSQPALRPSGGLGPRGPLLALGVGKFFRRRGNWAGPGPGPRPPRPLTSHARNRAPWLPFACLPARRFLLLQRRLELLGIAAWCELCRDPGGRCRLLGIVRADILLCVRRLRLRNINIPSRISGKPLGLAWHTRNSGTRDAGGFCDT